MEKINIEEKFQLFEDYWNPKVIASLNQQAVKLAKIKGEFVWHSHEQEDELFMVIKGHLIMEFRDKKVALSPGEILVVPKGVEHRPIAPDETHILLFEPQSTLNTGELRNERTVENLERL